jgi:hypothetical protein
MLLEQMGFPELAVPFGPGMATERQAFRVGFVAVSRGALEGKANRLVRAGDTKLGREPPGIKGPEPILLRIRPVGELF